MADLETLVTLILTLFAGLFGRDFIGRFLTSRQQREASIAASRHERESSVIAALVNLTQTSSAAQIQLTQDALTTLREMTVNMSKNMGELTRAITRHEEEAGDRLRGVTRATQEMVQRVAELDAGFQMRSKELEARFVTIIETIAALEQPNAARLAKELQTSGSDGGRRRA